MRSQQVCKGWALTTGGPGSKGMGFTRSLMLSAHHVSGTGVQQRRGRKDSCPHRVDSFTGIPHTEKRRESWLIHEDQSSVAEPLPQTSAF